MWEDRIIGRHTSVWDGRLPKKSIFSITKIHSGSIAQAAGIEAGQYYYAGKKARAVDWDQLTARAAEGEVVSRIYDTGREQLALVRTKGFPWGMRLEAPHFKLCDDLRRGMPTPGIMAERIMNAPEPLFSELVQAALLGHTRPHPKRILFYLFSWLMVGHARANEVIDAFRVPAAMGAIAKGDVEKARKLLPEPSRNIMVSNGTSLTALYAYTSAMIAARDGKPREDVVGFLRAALDYMPDCERIKAALRQIGEPVSIRPMRTGRAFPLDYRLPVVDPRVGLPGPDCPSLTLSGELARLRPHQIALVVLLGGYRANGPYSRSMENLGHLYPLIRDRLAMVHVITSALTLSEEDRAFTERCMQGETYALRRGVPLVVLTDGEDAVGTALGTMHSPFNYLLAQDGRILGEGQIEDDGLVWESLASLEAGSRAA